MAKRAIDILIEARDEASKVLNQVAGNVRKFGQQAGSTGSGGGIGAFTGMANAAMRLGAAVEATRIGVAAVRGITQAVKGDYDGMEATIRRLPMGIGEVAGMTADWLRDLKGINEEVRLVVERAQGEVEFGKAQDRLRAIAKQARENAADAVVSEFDRPAEAIEKRFRQRMEEIDKIKRANLQLGDRAIFQAEDAADLERFRALQNLRKMRDDAMREMEDADRKRTAESGKAFSRQFMTQKELLGEAINDAMERQARGEISVETMQRAIREARKQFDGPGGPAGIRLAPTVESRFLTTSPQIGLADTAKSSDQKLARVVDVLGRQQLLDSQRNDLLRQMIDRGSDMQVVEISA